ncbi:MAG: hypothetical protein WC979_01565 [Candidatus Pacearchaeota archaeon]|jgi:hypothetical protein|nr:hypothetical protein [Clostridia bacterium]
MILYHNLHFFDKYGKKLNLNKEEYVTVTVNRNDDTVVDYADAKIEVVTNVYGNIELFHIVKGGTKYNDKLTITINDKDTGTVYLIDSADFIMLGPDGEILSIQLPANPTGFCYPSYVYTGDVYTPKISTGLIETAQIYMLEEMTDINSQESVYTSPRTYKDIFNTVTTSLNGKFEDNTEDEISLFDIDYTSDERPFVNIVNVSTAIIDDGLSDEVFNGKRNIILNKSNAISFNVSVKSEVEGIFERSLSIYETVQGNDYIYATIKFRAEIIGEDERLKLMLENFGIQVNLQELKIFRDSDINEELPNFLLLNAKRKEMLLEYHNIFPYIGSYKALINIINYFGYGDTRLKEYWLNAKKTQKLKTKNSLASMSASTNLPIDLTSLHSFGNSFKPLPNSLNKQGFPLPAEDSEIIGRFGEDNVDFNSKENGNLTPFMKTEESRGITGKRVYQINSDIQEPTTGKNVLSNDLDSLKVIQAIQTTVPMPMEQDEIISIQEQYFKQIEIPMQLAQKGKHWQSEEMLPNNVWKKTNLFGLFYDITKESGEYDIYGMPITEDAFMFSEDEVIIKLFALREYLKNKFMPLNARIIDIVGEGIYFDRWAVNIWKDDVVAYEINRNDTVDFAINANDGLITDLQNYGEPNVEQPSDDTNISTLKDIFLNNFMNAGPFKNNAGPIACRTELILNDFILAWDDCPVTWDDLVATTWDDIAQKEMYEVEWLVEHSTKGKFTYNVRGKISTYKNVYVDLPYIGEYNITCILYDLTNHSVRKRKTLIVSLPNVDFIAFGRSLNTVLTWDELPNTTWDEMNCQWRNPAIANDVTWDDLDGLTWDDLDISKYKDQEKPFIQNQKRKIIRISEKDRYVGNITRVSLNTIICDGQYVTPKLRNAINGIPQDFVYLRSDEIIYRAGVLSADYSIEGETTVVCDSIPRGVNTNWDLLREVGGTVLIEGDISKVNNNNEGIAVGEYAIFEQDSINVPVVSNILITGTVAESSNIVAINTDVAINKVKSEYGKVYKLRTISNGNFAFNAETKTVTLPFIATDIFDNVTYDELIPGFSIIKVISNTSYGPIEQSLHVQHIRYDGTNTILDVIEIDNDMGIMVGSTNEISYEYWSFTVKLRHFIDNNENANTVFLNFNDYPYNAQFAYDSNDWRFDYIINDGSFSLLVTNIGFENDNTLLTLDDTHSELYYMSPDFDMSYITFDEDYARNRYGTDIYTWDNFDEVTWDDCSHLTWNMLEYNKAPLCEFEIMMVKPNGRIQFNELPFFEFKTIPVNGTLEEQFIAAVDELNSTENEGLQRFRYSLSAVGSPITYKINATAKGEGIYYLGYLQFANGVLGKYADPNYSHTYPVGNWSNWVNPYIYGLDNKYANWNPVARAYYEFGYDHTDNKGWYPAEKVDYSVIPSERYVYNSNANKFLYYEPADLNDTIYAKFPSLINSVDWRYADAYRLLYDYAITSPFTWDDLIASRTIMNIKRMTTLFFIATNSKIAGKNSYKWTITNHETKLDECVVTKEHLIWTFTKEGAYDVSLEIFDINGNSAVTTKQGLINVR